MTGLRAMALAALALAACGEEDPFLRDLQAPSPERRLAAAEFLGAQREEEAAPALVRALRDTVPDVRAKAAWALGRIRARAARPELEALLRDPDRRARQAAAGALMALEEPEAIPALRAALRAEPDPWVERDLERAVSYLEQFKGEADVGEATFR